jgi:hypothetical protein
MGGGGFGFNRLKIDKRVAPDGLERAPQGFFPLKADNGKKTQTLFYCLLTRNLEFRGP